MLTDYDENLESLVKTFVPRWTEIRIRKGFFEQSETKLPFVGSELLLIGEPDLLCFVTSKTCAEIGGYDYYPIGLRVTDAPKRRWTNMLLWPKLVDHRTWIEGSNGCSIAHPCV